jgi:hypothetical protein
VAGGDPPREADIDKTNAELDQGLRTCRSMLNDYRAALTGEQEVRAPAADDEAESAEPPGQEE